MVIVRRTRVPANLLRKDDYVFHGGIIVAIEKSRTGGLFPKSYIHLTFYTGEDYVKFTTEDHFPVDIERKYEEVTSTTKEKK